MAWLGSFSTSIRFGLNRRNHHGRRTKESGN
nr:MAG TPA: hypothetical protein [Caudoviricetes sp.]